MEKAGDRGTSREKSKAGALVCLGKSLSSRFDSGMAVSRMTARLRVQCTIDALTTCGKCLLWLAALEAPVAGMNVSTTTLTWLLPC